MSTWTHVHGIIQIDTQLMDEDKIRYLRKRLGPQKNDGYKKNKEGEYIRVTKMPMGSEGPVEYTIKKCKEKHCLVVNLIGYLRDFGKKDGYWSDCDNTRYIEHWFRDLLDDLEENCFWIDYAMLHYEADDEENGWMLQSIDSKAYSRREVVRIPVPKRGTLRRID